MENKLPFDYRWGVSVKKLQMIRENFNQFNIDGLLITNPFNRRYVTGFTGTAGIVLLTKSNALFITDFRYTEQAKKQINHFEIVEHSGPIENEISNQLKKHNITKLGFESKHVTFNDYKKYEAMFNVELIAVEQIIESLRQVKNEAEIAILKQAAKIADDAFIHILNYIRPGVKEIDIAIELEYFMRQAGATAASFDIIVASGYRSSLPHGIASEKKIEKGELVTLDFGALYDGYCSDITRTVAVGEVSDQLKEIYDIVLEAQQRGVDAIKPGMTGMEADSITRNYITEKGYGKNFGHSTGHGLGLEVHEGPTLSPRSTETLKPGMIVTVEPGIYIPNIGGCRIEDDIVITENGNDQLTLASKQFIQL